MTQLILCLFFISIVISIDDTPTPKITFIWLEHAHSFRRMLNSEYVSLPQLYRQKLQSIDYPYELILECDLLIEQTEQEFGRRFIKK